MNIKPESEIIAKEEINLYNYWQVLVKRKKILLCIFLIPLVIVTIISLSLPRYYRGESEIINPVIPAPDIVKLIENIDDTQKAKIFTNTPGAIKSVLASIPKKSTDRVNIIIETKTADMMPQAFKDLVDYISNLPEIKEESARVRSETNLKIEKLMEARKVNLVFLNQIMDMMRKRQISYIYANPADLIKKDADLSLEIMTLQKAKVKSGALGPLSISIQPSNLWIKKIIILAGILSLFAGIVVAFFLEYIDRMKAREAK